MKGAWERSSTRARRRRTPAAAEVLRTRSSVILQRLPRLPAAVAGLGGGDTKILRCNWCRRHILVCAGWQDVHDQSVAGPGDRRSSRDGRTPGRRRHSATKKRNEPAAAGAGGSTERVAPGDPLRTGGQRRSTPERGEYRGINETFEVFPGSVLRRQEATWIVAAEIVETTAMGPDRPIRGDGSSMRAPSVRRTHFEPHFVPETGFVSAYERVTRGSLDTVERRRVPALIDAEAARQVFINEALVAERPRKPVPGGQSRASNAWRCSTGNSIWAATSSGFELLRRRIPSEIHNGLAFEAWRGRPGATFDPSHAGVDLLDPDVPVRTPTPSRLSPDRGLAVLSGIATNPRDDDGVTR